MPNWCENELRVHGPKGLREDLLEKVRNTEEDEKTEFDFNKVVPYPEEYASLDLLVKKWERDNKEVPWNDRPPRPKDGYNQGGYEWCNQHWGTKWNASDVVVIPESSDDDDETSVITFSTPWGPPFPVIEKLSEIFPDLTFSLSYWEGGMGFMGEIVVHNGQIVNEMESEYSGNRGG